MKSKLLNKLPILAFLFLFALVGYKAERIEIPESVAGYSYVNGGQEGEKAVVNSGRSPASVAHGFGVEHSQ